MSKRKATDILLELEERIDTLSRRFTNMETLMKLVLKKLNERPDQQPVSSFQSSQPTQDESTQHQTQQAQVPITKDNFNNRPKTNKFSQIAAEAGLTVEEEPQQQAVEQVFTAYPSELPPDPSGEDMVEAPSRDPARGQRGPKNKSTKSSVSQILSKDERPLFLASIEVLDTNGQMINQTRTNRNGRWLMALAPGDYQIHVVKRFPPDSGKESVDKTYQVKIPPSDKPMELDPLSV